MSVTTSIDNQITCFHCGDVCLNDPIKINEKPFCCEGCKLVYEILSENNLCDYYDLNTTPGLSKSTNTNGSGYEFLDDASIITKLISFTDGNKTTVTFNIPQIHCSSCIWLLEHLYRIEKGVNQSRVNFLKREVSITYENEHTSLRKTVELLDRIGYTPQLNLENVVTGYQSTDQKRIYFKLGVAFFCFGNIMLLSFPEYFGLSFLNDSSFYNLFRGLNILLALPVLLYADTDFFRSAWSGLKQKSLNIDVPISLGILVMFFRSIIEIISDTGPGYMDSFAGLVLFMLIGRQLQNSTYRRLLFERDYKSYFPVAVTVLENGATTSKVVSSIQPGDRVMIRNEELLPADAILLKGDANIDYSFVTGENIPVPKKSGDLIYAGGKQIGAPIELEVIKKVSQSRLTQLWNESNFNAGINKNISVLVNRVSRWFTLIVILIATTAGVYHYLTNTFIEALNVFTAVLIITCPCALALSYPFTMGNSMRILGRIKFYIRNTFVIENISRINHFIFDKTGTITNASGNTIDFIGDTLTAEQELMAFGLSSSSNHPLSRTIAEHLDTDSKISLSDFKEIAGQGISAVISGESISLGSSKFIGVESISTSNYTQVFLKINERVIGYFRLSGQIRNGIKDACQALRKKYDIELLSGDNELQKQNFDLLFDVQKYNQSPIEKLTRVKSLQNNNRKVMMIGDGLNDAGALKMSNVGVAVSDNTNSFSPASDAIIEAETLHRLPEIIKFSHWSMNVVYLSYFFSLTYNLIGLFFAVQGILTPLTAAILMPLSSTSIVVMATLGSSIGGKMIFNKY